MKSTWRSSLCLIRDPASGGSVANSSLSEYSSAFGMVSYGIPKDQASLMYKSRSKSAILGSPGTLPHGSGHSTHCAVRYMVTFQRIFSRVTSHHYRPLSKEYDFKIFLAHSGEGMTHTYLGKTETKVGHMSPTHPNYHIIRTRLKIKLQYSNH